MMWKKMLILVFILNSIQKSVNSQNKLVGEAPFTMHGAHLIVNASINGSEPIIAAFDTGAQGGLLDLETSKKSNVKLGEDVAIRGANGQQRLVKRSNGNKISINGVEFLNSSFAIMDMSGFKKMGRPYDAIIGYNEISQYVMEIDYENFVLKFYEKESYRYKGSGQELDIDLSMRIPKTDVMIYTADDKLISGKAYIDTGASSAASLNSPVTKEYKMIENANKIITKQAMGATGAFQVFETRVQAVQIGEYKFPNVPITLSEAKKGFKADASVLGVVGNYIMSRFNVILDYSRNKMYITPNKNYSKKFAVNSSGISLIPKLTPESGFKIRNIDENSPASKLGILKGDQILSINNKKVKDYTYNELLDVLSGGGKTISIEWLHAGKKKKGTLKLKELI